MAEVVAAQQGGQCEQARTQVSERAAHGLVRPGVPVLSGGAVEVDHAQHGQRLQRETIFRAAVQRAGLVGQAGDLLLNPHELVADRARIGLVEQQEVQHHRGLDRGGVAVAVRHQAVGHGQYHFPDYGFGFAWQLATRAQQGERVQRPFQAPADFHETEGVAAHQALGVQPVDGGQSDDEPFQAFHHAA